MKIPTIDLSGRTVAVLGGDPREQEISRLAAASGATVRGYGFPWPPGGIAGVELAGSAEEALADADYALLPIPGIAADETLYAPAAPEPIRPDADLLKRLAPGAAVILGRATPSLRAAADAAGIAISEYEDDSELMYLRGPAIVEGVLGVAIANTDVTIHDSDVAVVGYGHIGSLLAAALLRLGARVHLIARNPVQRAAAYAAGCRPHPLEELPSVAGDIAMLFSAVPAAVIDREILSKLPPGALVVDVSAPPGSIDLEAAKSLGLRAVWARGMGGRAPVTVGRSQWLGISRRIEEFETRRRHAG